MVKKYVILADSSDGFEIPKQLTIINGEAIIERTIRLLKENGISDITITAHDKRFNYLDAVKYKPKSNYYIPDFKDYKLNKGYWLNAFPIELLNEPITFLFGDVYYSEKAIKTIVNTNTTSTLFFCTYNNKKNIKKHDEPLAYKVVDYELFKKHIKEVKLAKDKGLCCREPIVWELYRSINNQELNVHKMTKNYKVINDISCDIDKKEDILKLLLKIGGIEMVKLEVIEEFTLKKFDELKNVKRKGRDENGRLFIGDTFECNEEMANYLTGDNDLKKEVAKVIGIKQEEKTEEKPKTKKTKKTKK